jgi:ABC-2 type transport system permease protein
MTTTAPQRPVPASLATAGHRGFGGVLRSEWIKLRSLRSTFWCSVIAVLISAGISGLAAFGISYSLTHPVEGAAPDSFPLKQVQPLLHTVVTAPTQLVALVIAVLGVLMIGGEYGTGMIRSTLAASPRRLAPLFAKIIVVAVAMMVVSAVAVLLSLLIGYVVLGANGLHADLGDGALWLSLGGDVLYLGLIAAFSVAVGSIIRNSAGGIATVVGVILVLPTVFTIIAGLINAAWLRNVGSLLPSEAGGRLAAYIPEGTKAGGEVAGVWTLEPWVGGLVLLAWVAVMAVLGAVLLRRRDA